MYTLSWVSDRRSITSTARCLPTSYISRSSTVLHSPTVELQTCCRRRISLWFTARLHISWTLVMPIIKILGLLTIANIRVWISNNDRSDTLGAQYAVHCATRNSGEGCGYEHVAPVPCFHFSFPLAPLFQISFCSEIWGHLDFARLTVTPITTRHRKTHAANSHDDVIWREADTTQYAYWGQILKWQGKNAKIIEVNFTETRHFNRADPGWRWIISNRPLLFYSLQQVKCKPLIADSVIRGLD